MYYLNNMGIYDPLFRHLERQAGHELRLSFSQLTEILGRSLPRSAYERREFWNNNPVGHVHAQAWRKAGWITRDVDIAAQEVSFVRERFPVSQRLRDLAHFRQQGPEASGHDVSAMIREDRER